MKVLIVSKALTVATYRKKLEELAGLGAKVTAVVPPAWREEGAERRLEPGTNHGYDLIVSPLRWNGHFHLHYYPQLPHIIRHINPDIVHVDEEPYNLATFLAVRAAGPRPSLFFSWQNIYRRYPFPFSLMERSVYSQVSGAIAGSEAAAEVLRRKGFAKQQWVIPQFGVDPEVFKPNGNSHQGFTIGFLNRLIPAKGPLLALEAFETLPEDCRLLFVGDGPLRVELEAAIEERKLGARVSLQPGVPSREVPALMRSLDALLLPSLTTPSWKEQFGRVLIEAMASGVPVIGSDSGEIPNVIGDAGLIVPEGDTHALGVALKRLYEEPALYEQLAASGRRRILARFTHARIAAQTFEAYREMMRAA